MKHVNHDKMLEVHSMHSLLDAGKTIVLLTVADEAQAFRYGHFLSSDEKQRANRYRLLRDRHASMTAHGIKRYVIARLLGASHEELIFSHDARRKPLCANRGAPAFNISHCQRHVAIAFSSRGEIGVDIELSRRFGTSSIAGSALTESELSLYQSLGLSSDYLLSIWTKKEALTKASGHGLYIDFSQINIEKTGTQGILEAIIDDVRYFVYSSRIGSTFLAIAGKRMISPSSLAIIHA